MIPFSATVCRPILSPLFKVGKKLSEQCLPVSGAKTILTNRFYIFKLRGSARNRPRELKLVSLEPSGNENSKCVSKSFLASSVNETAMQNFW
jgi:hypothetical protein